MRVAHLENSPYKAEVLFVRRRVHKVRVALIKSNVIGIVAFVFALELVISIGPEEFHIFVAGDI